MAGRANNTGGGRLPPMHVPDPESDEAYKVNQVTTANRDKTHLPGEEIRIALYSPDCEKLLHHVYIPRTREFPDIVNYHGVSYVFFDTQADPPAYTTAMVATGSFHPQNKDKSDETSK